MTEIQTEYRNFINNFQKSFPIKQDLRGTLQLVAGRVDLTLVYGKFEEGDCGLKNSLYIVNDIILQSTKDIQFVPGNG
jgi:hypothetical protein